MGLRQISEIQRLRNAVLVALRTELSRTHRAPVKGDVSVADYLVVKLPDLRSVPPPLGSLRTSTESFRFQGHFRPAHGGAGQVQTCDPSPGIPRPAQGIVLGRQLRVRGPRKTRPLPSHPYHPPKPLPLPIGHTQTVKAEKKQKQNGKASLFKKNLCHQGRSLTSILTTPPHCLAIGWNFLSEKKNKTKQKTKWRRFFFQEFRLFQVTTLVASDIFVFPKTTTTTTNKVLSRFKKN